MHFMSFEIGFISVWGWETVFFALVYQISRLGGVNRGRECNTMKYGDTW